MKKVYNVEPTELQKKTADELIAQKVRGEKLNKGKAILKAGGSKSTSISPKIVTESLGFKTYMAKAGVTEENLANMLAADLEAKPAERLGEMKLAAELMDLKENNLNINIKKSDEGLDTMADIINSMSDEEGESEETS